MRNNLLRSHKREKPVGIRSVREKGRSFTQEEGLTEREKLDSYGFANNLFDLNQGAKRKELLTWSSIRV